MNFSSVSFVTIINTTNLFCNSSSVIHKRNEGKILCGMDS